MERASIANVELDEFNIPKKGYIIYIQVKSNSKMWWWCIEPVLYLLVGFTDMVIARCLEVLK